MTLVVFFISYSTAMAQKADHSDKKQKVKKEYKTQKAQEGPSVTNKQAETELNDEKEKEKKKIKAEETAKENLNKGVLKPRHKKVVKRKGKGKVIEKKPLQ